MHTHIYTDTIDVEHIERQFLAKHRLQFKTFIKLFKDLKAFGSLRECKKASSRISMNKK
jgi:hypothetical protein